MALATEQLQQIMTTAMAEAMKARGDGGAGGNGGSGKRGLSEKDFRRVDKFSGHEVDWLSWEFDFKIAMRSACPQAAQAVAHAEAHMDIEVTGALLESDPQIGKDMVGMVSRSAELYEVLCMLTTGDAKTLIRNIISADGLVAWQTLRKTYCR